MDRRRRARRIAGTFVGLLLTVGVFASAANADPTYGVMNAAGGIYWRSAPDWNTAVAISGFGVYNGTVIAVHCYQSGTSVPGSADTMWEYATVVAGPGYGTGWLNEHFINDGQPINQPSPGVPPCNAPPPPTSTPTPPPASISVAVGAQYGCANCYALNVQVSNFPTATFTYDCHDNSGPGGADTAFYSHTVTVSSPNQSSWSGVFCYDSAPYAAYIVINGIRSNAVTFPQAVAAPAPPPSSGSPSTPSDSSAPPASATSSDGYYRAAAVTWARKHAMDKPFDGTSCTWFISQALWQGGLAKTSVWTSDGHHGHVHQEPGTKTVFYTPGFVRYILNTYPRSYYRQLHFGPSGNAVAGAQVGDVITYDWDGDTAGGNLDGLNHAALITRIDATGYPLVSEWSANGTKPTPYTERGWTWSKLHNHSLATLYPHVRAWLLHIDTRPI
jgi:hypothetical protein